MVSLPLQVISAPVANDEYFPLSEGLRDYFSHFGKVKLSSACSRRRRSMERRLMLALSCEMHLEHLEDLLF